MDELFKSAANLFIEQLSVIDFFIAGLIVAFDEYIIKKGFCKGNEKYKAIYLFAPIVLGGVGYLVYSLVVGSPWLTGLLHGLLVGFTSMGFYDVILRIFTSKGASGVKEIGEAIREEVKKK